MQGPPFSGRFKLEINKKEIGAFMECSGLSVEIEMEELKEGGQNEYVHRLPGRMKWPNVVLKRGVTEVDDLFEWLTSASTRYVQQDKGTQDARRVGAIELIDSEGRTVRRWDFKGAYPVKWKGPDLVAAATDVAVEELEFIHDGFLPNQA